MIQAAKRTEKRARVHIKINTGMNRLGISSEKFAAFAENVTARKEISIEGIWTHFATSELPDDDFTHHQLKLFERAVRRVKKNTPTSCSMRPILEQPFIILNRGSTS